MSLESVFGVGQSALVAQTYRLNVIAENLANAEVAAATPEGAYKGQSVFRSVLNEAGDSMAMGVRIDGTVEDALPAAPTSPNPLADEDGFVYMSNVIRSGNGQQMAASRSYKPTLR